MICRLSVSNDVWCVLYMQMIQAIQVLRFHLLELEKVSEWLVSMFAEKQWNTCACH